MHTTQCWGLHSHQSHCTFTDVLQFPSEYLGYAWEKVFFPHPPIYRKVRHYCLLYYKSSIHLRLSFPEFSYFDFYQNLWVTKIGGKLETVLFWRNQNLSSLYSAPKTWTRMYKPSTQDAKFKEALSLRCPPCIHMKLTVSAFLNLAPRGLLPPI